MGRIIIYGNKSGEGGADTSIVTATSADVLTGKIIVDVDGEPVTGAMPNNGAVAPRALNAGEAYQIPEGYHDGNGIVSTNNLSNQTQASATENDILTNKNAWINGKKVEGKMLDNSTTTSNGTVPGISSDYAGIPTREGTGLQYNVDTSGTARISLCPPAGYYPGSSASYINRPASDFGNVATNQVLEGYTFTSSNGLKLTGTVSVQSVLSFNVAPYSSSQFSFTWKNPSQGAFSGVIIVGKTGSYPTSANDGTRWYVGGGNNNSPNGTSTVIVEGFSASTTYYFRIFSYAIKNNAEWVGNGYLEKTSSTPAKPVGSKTFTSSGTFTVPSYVFSIDIFVLGGGAAGGGSSDLEGEYPAAAGGGGGGYTNTVKSYSVTPGQTFYVTVGAGGAAASPGWGTGGTGGTTSFGSVISAGGGYGGEGGSQDQQRKGGSGGSGGGGSTQSTGYAGGSDGSNGNGNTGYHAGGIGQGRTTRAFAESSNTLYAGGGGGGPGRWSGTRAPGGAGGGGMGGNLNVGPGAGSANTGGGGGGGGSSSSWCYGGNGGSGICIVRWGY